jgi:uncharacterized membrane protein
MSSFRFTVEIIAPQERIWSVLTDVERWPEWNPTVKSAKRLEPGALAVGSRTKIVQPKLMPAVWRVTELDEDSATFVWLASRPGVKVIATHLIDGIGDGCRVTLALNYGGLLGPLIARRLKHLNWDYLTKEAEGLKRRCERDAELIENRPASSSRTNP